MAAIRARDARKRPIAESAKQPGRTNAGAAIEIEGRHVAKPLGGPEGIAPAPSVLVRPSRTRFCGAVQIFDLGNGSHAQAVRALVRVTADAYLCMMLCCFLAC